jgi:hypothetical protein
MEPKKMLQTKNTKQTNTQKTFEVIHPEGIE